MADRPEGFLGDHTGSISFAQFVVLAVDSPLQGVQFLHRLRMVLKLALIVALGHSCLPPLWGSMGTQTRIGMQGYENTL